MELRCRPGDLAICVFAENAPNIGLIVRVLKRDSGRSKLAMKDKGPLWTVECAQPMTYKLGEKFIFRRRGAVPDSYLRPIRGERPPSIPKRKTRSLEQA